MKVLVVTNQLIKIQNNSLFCIENLYDILERFSKLGELCVCAEKYSGRSSNIVGSSLSSFVKTENVFFVKDNHLRSSTESKKIIESCVKKSDLIIGYVPCVNAYTACRFAHKYKKRFMAYVVACPWDAYWNHSIKGKIIAPYAFLSLKKCLRQSDYALYVTKHFLQKRYPCKGLTCGCSDVRIPRLDETVLYNRLNALGNLSRSCTINLVTIANYSVRFKGQHFVIKALAKLKKKGIVNFNYYLIGGGDKKRLEQLAKKNGVSELVHFQGIIPHNQIFNELDKMHIYIQPSLQEGLPRAVVEAMSRGLTCICANTAAMPEMVDSEYVVRRKSVDDIVNVLKIMTVEKMINQAKRNFEEAKKYEESVLDKERNSFFEQVIQNKE